MIFHAPTPLSHDLPARRSTGRARPHLTPDDGAALLRRMRSPDVRSLVALVLAPTLIAPDRSPFPILEDAWRETTLRDQAAWLEQLDADPRPLSEHLLRSNARQLGRYAEALWEFWFTHLPGAMVHAAGLAVHDGHQVRGELDFILTLPRLTGIQHLETGYKFFLHCPPGDHLSRFVGTHPKDRLDRKWRHMVDAQLPLSQSALARAALPRHLAAVPITPRACLQGHIFHPLDASDAPGMDENSGPRWCRFGSGPINRLLQRTRAWSIPGKRNWMAPALIQNVAATHSAILTPRECGARLALHFAGSTQAQLVTGLALDSDGFWRETSRVMVVASGWSGAD